MLTFLVLSPLVCLYAQADYADSKLAYGNLPVGFSHHLQVDSSRVYRRVQDYTERLQYRELPVSRWYPAQAEAAKRMQIGDYLQVLKEEEEWENLPNAFVLDWFNYPRNAVTEKNSTYATQAFADAVPKAGNYPVVLYAPSFRASSSENFMLCEYLASHGYLVLSIPSRGPGSIMPTGGTAEFAGAQQRDLEYLFGYAGRLAQADLDRVYTIGFSFGGLANIPFAMNNRFIDGVISLDGSIKYNLPAATALPQFDLLRMRVPFVHFRQKTIPEKVIQEDGIDDSTAEQFAFLDSLRGVPAYEFNSPNLTHGHFASYGILFEPRDDRQDRPAPLILSSYARLCEAVLHTLHAMESYKATGVWDAEAYENLIFNTNHPLLRKTDGQKLPSVTVNYFFDAVRTAGFGKMDSVYNTFLELDPTFTIPQLPLNKIGLQLGLSDKDDLRKAGIEVLDFAVQRYPDSANLHDSLATLCQYQGLKDRAIYHFKKSLALFPGNENAKNQLRRLGAY
ncbi:tetratricopeptide repeat protein [Neolewinella persica]|uniref:tetratricopeptide repeat protein n=1 Tax=Neolewinella persica TaxID=70998 RepID=UPI0003657F89|nr:hypothetical protein [Neolewinella persica]